MTRDIDSPDYSDSNMTEGYQCGECRSLERQVKSLTQKLEKAEKKIREWSQFDAGIQSGIAEQNKKLDRAREALRACQFSFNHHKEMFKKVLSEGQFEAFERYQNEAKQCLTEIGE